MSFADSYMPETVPGYPCLSIPLTKTTIAVNAGGREQRNREWEQPLLRFILPESDARTWDTVQGLLLHWRLMNGPLTGWPFRDPLDFASIELDLPNVTPAIARTDQVLGVGDGSNRSFQIVKRYERDGLSETRAIQLPVLDTVVIDADGVPVSDADYTISRPGGVVTFDTPPANGVVLSCGFLFDVAVRFESDDQIEGVLRAAEVGAFSEISLIEVRPC